MGILACVHMLDQQGKRGRVDRYRVPGASLQRSQGSASPCTLCFSKARMADRVKSESNSNFLLTEFMRAVGGVTSLEGGCPRA